MGTNHMMHGTVNGTNTNIVGPYGTIMGPCGYQLWDNMHSYGTIHLSIKNYS